VVGGEMFFIALHGCRYCWVTPSLRCDAGTSAGFARQS